MKSQIIFEFLKYIFVDMLYFDLGSASNIFSYLFAEDHLRGFTRPALHPTPNPPKNATWPPFKHTINFLYKCKIQLHVYFFFYIYYVDLTVIKYSTHFKYINFINASQCLSNGSYSGNHNFDVKKKMMKSCEIVK